MLRHLLPLLCLSGVCVARPNVLVLFMDDLGIGDIEPYGNTTIPMPHLARLCKEGVKLDHHTSPNVICTPSRAAFLTGRYAVRSGMSPSKKNAPQVLIYTSNTSGLPKNETTFGKIMKKAGYTTGYVGKWHLGLNAATWGDQEHGPLGHGFDYFYGLPHTLVPAFDRSPRDNFFMLERSLGTHLVIPVLILLFLRFFIGGYIFLIIMIITVMFSWLICEHFYMFQFNQWWNCEAFVYRFLNSYILENNQVVSKPIDLPSLGQRLTDASLGFINSSVNTGAPFLLVHAFTATHTPITPGEKFVGKSEHGAYGDLLMEVDDNIGQMLNLLRTHGIENDTLVYFSSDHGGDRQSGREGGYNGIFRGGKFNGALEGGMRVPGILKWPGKIKPGKVISTPTSSLDFLPTLAEITGSDTSGLKLDGESLLPIIVSDKHPRRSLYHFCDYQIFAMRTEFKKTTYKLIFQEPELKDGLCPDNCACLGGTIIKRRRPYLFDINKDPSELEPIDSKSDQYKRIQSQMFEEFLAFKSDIDQNSMVSQLDSFWANMPMPWLQPYMNV